jgi:cation transport regulator
LTHINQADAGWVYYFNIMPYASNAALPEAIQERLPIHAQDIYREAFNHAWESYRHDLDQEAIAHRIAWAAVKRTYRKVGGVWMTKSVAGSADL